MWSIYFENVIDCRSVKRQKQLKIVDSAIFKTFYLFECFFFVLFFLRAVFYLYVCRGLSQRRR